MLFEESVTFNRLAYLGLVVTEIVGLKLLGT